MATSRSRAIPFNRRRDSPKSGRPGPNFRLTRGDLSDISLADFEGKVKILNVAPAFDPGVGAAWRAGSKRRRATAATWSC